MKNEQRHPPYLFGSLTAIAVSVGTLAAYLLRWTCDDAYISYRYAENFAGGLGLVYNAGEHVEGYTNFLWVLITGALRAIGFDTVEVSIFLGILFAAGTLAIFGAVSYRMQGRTLAVAVPFTSLALALNYDVAVWATSGLETSLFTFLLSLGFYLYFYSRRSESVRTAATGGVLALAAMTRPDGGLFLLLGGVLLLVDGLRRREAFGSFLRRLFLFGGAAAVLLLPYLFWKYSYYGDLLPNTYYAKSGGDFHFEQGFYYVWLYFRAYPLSLLFAAAIPALALPLLRTRFSTSGKPEATPPEASLNAGQGAMTAALLGVLLYLTLFVARVGGDFMFARFVIPVVPFIYYLIEASAFRLLENRHTVRVVLLLLLAGAVGAERWVRNDLLLGEKNGRTIATAIRGIIDEHWFYTYPRCAVVDVGDGSKAVIKVKDEIQDARVKLSLIDAERMVGRMLAGKMEKIDSLTVLLFGQCCLGYYGRFPVCIESNGLTDSVIAHQPITKRDGRIGHEKFVTSEYMISRGVDLAFDVPEQWSRVAGNVFKDVVFMMPGNIRVPASLVTYDRQIVRRLHEQFGRDFRYLDFERYLDGYIARVMPYLDAEQVRADYRFFNDYYFLHNDDEPRRRAVATYIDTMGNRPLPTPEERQKRDIAAAEGKLALLEEAYGESHRNLVEGLEFLAHRYDPEQEGEKLERAAKRFLVIAARLNTIEPAQQTAVLIRLGDLYTLQHRYREARTVLEIARDMTVESYGPGLQRLRPILERLVPVYRELGLERELRSLQEMLERSGGEVPDW